MRRYLLHDQGMISTIVKFKCWEPVSGARREAERTISLFVSSYLLLPLCSQILVKCVFIAFDPCVVIIRL